MMDAKQTYTLMQREDTPIASSLQLYFCQDPTCGPHIVAFNSDKVPICEMIIPRNMVTDLISELLALFPPEVH